MLGKIISVLASIAAIVFMIIAAHNEQWPEATFWLLMSWHIAWRAKNEEKRCQ